jgi:nickel/cobalt transporter (NicO) family protein
MEGLILAGTAAAIAFVHTALGPDHYIPFAALGAARRWSTRRTLAVTALCGVGHIVASIVMAFAAVGVGSVAMRITGITEIRGDVAAWLLLSFGVAYALYGLKFFARNRSAHTHEHVHPDGTRHAHGHSHDSAHLHPHIDARTSGVTVAWALFIVFLFGPCEPLIPLVMVPASQGEWGALAAVIAVFSVTTIATMLAIVWLLSRGAPRLASGTMAPYAHTAAGVAVAMCGAAMLLGL